MNTKLSTGRIVGGLFLLALLGILVQSMPDIARYLRIRNM